MTEMAECKTKKGSFLVFGILDEAVEHMLSRGYKCSKPEPKCNNLKAKQEGCGGGGVYKQRRSDQNSSLNHSCSSEEPEVTVNCFDLILVPSDDCVNEKLTARSSSVSESAVTGGC